MGHIQQTAAIVRNKVFPFKRRPKWRFCKTVGIDMVIRIILGCFLSGSLLAQNTYTGVWSGGTDHKLWVDANWVSFKAKWDELNNEGYRLVDIETAVVNGERHYSGVWEPGSDPYKLWVEMDWKTLKRRWDELEAQNLRLVDLEVYVENGNRYFMGVWRQGTHRQKILVDATWESFRSTDKNLRRQNYRLWDVETYILNGQRKYASVWREGEEMTLLLTGLDQNTFEKIQEGLNENDLQLIDVEIVLQEGQYRYMGLWREGGGRQHLLIDVPWRSFLSQWKRLRDDQMILTDLEIISPTAQPVITATEPKISPPTPAPSSSTSPPVAKPSETENTPDPIDVQYGKASYYGDKFHGRPTASGELYDRNKLTAAHRTLPFGTRCRVTNLVNGKSVIVRVNDRGPHVEGRVIDLSYKAAEQIGLVRAGIVDVKVEVLPDSQ